MDPEALSAGSAGLQQQPPNYCLLDTNTYPFQDDETSNSHNSTPRATLTSTTSQPMCAILPASVQSALDFVVDMTQLIIPSLFMPSLSDECLITAAILDGTGARSYIHACKSLGCAAPNSPSSRPSSAESNESAEPGDTFGFEPRNCASSDANWQSMAWRTKSVGTLNMLLRMPQPPLLEAKLAPPLLDEPLSLAGCATGAPQVDADLPRYTRDMCSAVADAKSSAERHLLSAPASDAGEPSAPSLADFAAVDARLLDVNHYLLRRIRKLELTNQIVREAYTEVQEMLQAERQSKITQLKTLERKHEEDMERLVQEYQDRADRSHGGNSSDSDSDTDYVFHPGFTTSATRSGARVPAERKLPTSSSSSSLMHSALDGGCLSPLSIRRTASDTACLSVPAEALSQGDVTIEFLRDGTSDSDTDSDFDESENDDAQSEASWETDGDDDDDRLEHTMSSYDAITFSSVYFNMVDSDNDAGGESDDSDEESSGLADDEAVQHSVADNGNDFVAVDPAQAVIGRYYALTGVLSIAADIEDIPSDGYEGGTAARTDEDGYHYMTGSEQDRHASSGNDFATLDAEWQAQEIWDAIRSGATDAGSGLLSTDTQKSSIERELELISSLPADQRIAKFVCRASSHLKQGARGGLSLGFMMHNLEALSDQYASDHHAILCAFIECLYQLTEALTPAAAPASESPHLPETVLPPSALAKHVRSEMHSSSLAVSRIISLLHTFITRPDDQETVLRQLEQLSEANRDIRLAKHEPLLRMLYDNELVDRASLLQWYSTAPAPGLDGHVTEAAGERGRLLRLKAAPLLVEASSSSGACSSATAIGEIYQQVVATGSSDIASASSTPNMMGLTAARRCTGALTPASDENTTLHSQSSDCECAGNASLVRGSRKLCHSAGILGIGRKTSSRASLGGADAVHHADKLRPTKQVTFAAV
ncbi:hypothetical protein GGI20_000399 [Coemansia sp. BCRC 34301]|nr:hypothetical protein GGI20_000399 [Coemansia sp. BCRC 34301]